MTIDEAIELLKCAEWGFPFGDNEIYYKALQLGIEALKWIKQNRYAEYPHHIPPLAGETQALCKIDPQHDKDVTKTLQGEAEDNSIKGDPWHVECE